ncbi:MAG: hypothetical protein OQK73_13300 [Gammaproteobacteria bacterium]|nr:hypothetical protein [Gammaproteobacteria bacterium]
MERKIFLNVLVISLLAVAIAIFFPAEQEEVTHRDQSLPWQITPTSNGSIKVFNLTLGQSTIADAVQRLNEVSEVSLFVSPQGKHVVEVYFNQTRLAGLRAKIVLTAAISDSDLQAMFNRGTRISTLGDGSRKVTLHPDDLERTKQSAISVITYLPKAKLDEELLRARFGEPTRRIQEKGRQTIHWLYPQQGLDIALDTEEGKAVFQYLPPLNFDQVINPLIEQGEELF